MLKFLHLFILSLKLMKEIKMLTLPFMFSKKVHAQMKSDVVLSKMEHHIQPLRNTGQSYRIYIDRWV